MALDLRVTCGRVRRVRIPATPAYAESAYRAESISRTLIELVTAAGVVGIGEAPGADEVFASVPHLVASVLGEDLRSRHAICTRLTRSLERSGGGPAAYAGVEVAAWDAVARAYRVPLQALLGGSQGRSRIEAVCVVPGPVIPFIFANGTVPSAVPCADNVGRAIAYAKEQAESPGFRAFKYVTTGVSLDSDIRVMQELRTALGDDVRLQFDANAAYTPVRAIALCRALAELRVELIVDPTDDIEGLALVRAQSRIPIATRLRVRQLDQLPSLARRRAADILLADLAGWGGLLSYQTMVRTAEVMGLGLGIPSTVETGIGLALNLQLAAAFPALRQSVDAGMYVLPDTLVCGDHLALRKGQWTSPASPGLGVQLDERAVQRYTVDEVRVG